MRGIILAVGIALAAPAAATAAVQPVTVVNHAHVRPAALKRVETAIEEQSSQLARFWHTPTVAFRPDGWKVTLLRGRDEYPSGAHFDNITLLGPWRCVDANDCVSDPGGTIAYTPTITVYTAGDTYAAWSAVLSHEVMETLVDPDQQTRIGGTLVEVCDPARGTGYVLDDVNVSDFALPSYYHPGSTGPWDFRGYLPSPERGVPSAAG